MIDESYMTEELSLYAGCMEEIKRRQKAISSIRNKKQSTLFSITNVEFVALQLRKILELIALANLVANVEEYRRIRQSYATDWNAKRIIEQIKRINPDYYPQPITRMQKGEGQYEWIHPCDGFLT